MGSIYDKKGRVRKPRVHITYEVEKNGAMVMKELPFVVGVMADLQGDTTPDKKLIDKARQFKDIDRDNFDEVLGGLNPSLKFRAENRLQDDGSELSVELEFKSMADFSPDSIVQQVQPLRDMLDIRNKLKDMLSRSESNDRLEDVLNEIVSNESLRGKLMSALGGGAAAADAGSADAGSADAGGGDAADPGGDAGSGEGGA